MFNNVKRVEQSKRMHIWSILI